MYTYEPVLVGWAHFPSVELATRSTSYAQWPLWIWYLKMFSGVYVGETHEEMDSWVLESCILVLVDFADILKQGRGREAIDVRGMRCW